MMGYQRPRLPGQPMGFQPPASTSPAGGQGGIQQANVQGFGGGPLQAPFNPQAPMQGYKPGPMFGGGGYMPPSFGGSAGMGPQFGGGPQMTYPSMGGLQGALTQGFSPNPMFGSMAPPPWMRGQFRGL